jgi:group I intron endonuclease
MNLYLVTNLLDGSLYVGKTSKEINIRWSKHLNAAEHGSPTHLHRAIRKYGVEAFTVEPLILLESDFTDDESLNDGERLMIRLLRVNCKLYNLTDGGDGVSNPSAEIRKKIGDGKRGKIVSEETRQRLRDSHIGKIFPDEQRRKISDGNRGKVRSAETKAKMSAARKGKPLSEEHRMMLSELKRGKPWSAARRAAQEARENGGQHYAL